MMHRRHTMMMLGAGALIQPLDALAQQVKTSRRVACLIAGSSASSGALSDAFRRGLRDLGWVEGSDLILDIRYANGDSRLYDGLAAELLAFKPDLVFAPATQPALAVRRISPDVPIVIATSIDPVGSGLVESWAHPGRHTTGLSTIGAELGAKRLQLLRDCVPKLMRVAVLSDPTPGFSPDVLETVLNAGRRLLIGMSVVNASNELEIAPAFRTIERDRPDGVFVLEGALFLRHRQSIVARAAAIRVPTIYPDGQYVDDGGLMSYGADYVDQCRRAATYADKILRGAKPNDLPVEQPRKFELIVNMNTALAQGMKFPPSILVRADRVIQ